MNIGYLIDESIIVYLEREDYKYYTQLVAFLNDGKLATDISNRKHFFYMPYSSKIRLGNFMLYRIFTGIKKFIRYRQEVTEPIFKAENRAGMTKLYVIRYYKAPWWNRLFWFWKRKKLIDLFIYANDKKSKANQSVGKGKIAPEDVIPLELCEKTINSLTTYVMGFKPKEADKLLTQCHRRCCICHRFCGIKMELDHIEQRADNKDDSIENAIPVCFECHAEIHLYNDRHPKGRKFHPDEIREHKKQWLEICEQNPEVFIQPLQRSDVGPLYALIDELKFNKEVRANNSVNENGCRFETKQFDRALSEGYLSIIHEDITKYLMDTYRKMKKANTTLVALVHANCQKYIDIWEKRLIKSIEEVDNLDKCYDLLIEHLK